MEPVELMRTLVVGYGNPYRTDDGVGYHVLVELARQLNRPPLGLDDDGLDDLGREVDLVCLRQLLPELADKLGGYDLAIFVDAHTGAYEETLRIVDLEPNYASSAFTHHMKPETLLGLAKAFSSTVPRGCLFSVRGYDFDLGEGLSERTAALADQVTRRILEIINQGPG
jgi:hydrogenase maturation protease